MIRAFTIGLITIAIQAHAGLKSKLQGDNKAKMLENLVYPWPDRADWPSLKISYNYILSGSMKGTEIVKDGTYTYSKDKGYDEPKVEKTFSYHTQIKVDSKNDRAIQHLWQDEKRDKLLSINAIDFNNARMLVVNYMGDDVTRGGKCKIYQFSESMMTAKQILNWIWQPRSESPLHYRGLQCASWTDMDVHGFSGTDTQGIPYQTFFDAKTKLPVKGFSGEGITEDSSGSTKIEFDVHNHKVVSKFKNKDGEFYPLECLKDYEFEAVDQAMMPIVDFGLLLL